MIFEGVMIWELWMQHNSVIAVAFDLRNIWRQNNRQCYETNSKICWEISPSSQVLIFCGSVVDICFGSHSIVDMVVELRTSDIQRVVT